MTGYDAVLIVSFGGPEGPDDVLPFLANVTSGRGIPADRLAEVAGRYLDRGGISPINEQCRQLVAALGRDLAHHDLDLPVYWGNRNWHPMLADTVATMAADGIRRALAIVTSAYSSRSGCRQYLDDIETARASVGEAAPVIDKVRPYFDHPGFVVPFIDATEDALSRLGASAVGSHIVFTAHSIPEAMDSCCDYRAQLGEVAQLVADGLATRHPWTIAWQSRSGPPSVPWLEPDINDHLAELAGSGIESVVAVPIGFVSDHMEVVFDLDTEAAATAAILNLRFERAATPGTTPDPRFVSMWRALIEERLDPALERPGLSLLQVRPDICPVGCCLPE